MGSLYIFIINETSNKQDRSYIVLLKNVGDESEKLNVALEKKERVRLLEFRNIETEGMQEILKLKVLRKY